MRKILRSPRFSGQSPRLEFARILLVHGELTARLALRTLLEAGGYSVDVSASTGEALTKLDEGVYDLVLIEARSGKNPSGLGLLSYARVKSYRPATALITSEQRKRHYRSDRLSQHLAIYTENVPYLLGKIADVIAERASRRYRPLKQAV